MPKFRYLALATASLMVLAVPAGEAYAASAHTASKPVLTIKSKGGPAVKKGAKLTASLAKGTKVTFALGSSFTATCKSSAIKNKVTANPSGPGKATLSVTAQSMSKCSLSTTLATLNSITALNLPFNATISTAKGDPVTITGHKKSKPVAFEAKITVGTSSATCIFTAAKVSGHASNTGNKVSFKSQTFALDTAASSALCSEADVSTATFSATYGPVRDTSVRHSPKVFVK